MVSKTEDNQTVDGKILINGSWTKTTTTREVINPAFTNDVVGHVGMAEESHINEAIMTAQDAFEYWSHSPLEERIESMTRAWERLKDKVDEYTSLFVRENGKTLVEAKKDIKRCVEILETLPTTIKDWYNPTDLSNDIQQVEIRRRPRGVTAVITPWNSPMILTFKRVIPAILTGNTVILKPATNCPLTIITVMREIADCLPPGVLNIITGSGQFIGDYLAKDSRIRMISFVGGTDTGKELMEKSASTLKKLHLELGGNDPAIVLEDARLDKEEITKIKNGILRGAGQVCSAIKRIYVHESRYEELLDKLKREFNKVTVGEGIHPDSTMGPLNNKGQYEFVTNLLKNAEKNGATVEHYGRKLNEEKWDKGYFMLPAIVTNVKQQDEIVHAEQFGPVIPIIPFTDLDQAVKYANDTEFGLRASVWTQDSEEARKLSDRIEAGAVFHNNHTIFIDLNLDFPGIKESGLGGVTRYGGFEHFTDSYGFAN
ncbi:aldehyde dehydrogenase family protein [Alteribacillus iranensis]|uniref:Acyl-CoA reductase n=1 Tax=Alteribacillus iranensis TaxID=930128 RepID=A0A1I2F0P2_9BACI|nr:aldehyde dehydrogenase family protein [Alteribacillus iranensis]SFE98984.1 Acyl-CoA reductase [Alteribacillus iranensis]